MSYTDLRDFEEEYRTTSPEGVTVRVEKMGGGTLGNAYPGTWRYIVTDAHGNEIGRGQDCETPTPHTHAKAAKVILTWFADSAS